MASLENAAAPELEPTPPAKMPRRHDLDALRALAMLLGIAIHAALAYIPLPEAAWSVQDISQSESYGTFMGVIHGFRMQLFFLVSGFFTAMLWRKRGLKALLKQRSKRILLPFVIGLFTIVPAVWIVSIAAIATKPQAVADNAKADLWVAASSNDEEKTKESLANGAEPNELKPGLGETPLSLAAAHGNVEAIELLIAGGADVNARNRDGATPLHIAALFHRADAAQTLIKHGADPKARNRLGETPEDMPEADGIRKLLTAALRGIDFTKLSANDAIYQILRQADRSPPTQKLPLSPVNGSGATTPEEGDQKSQIQKSDMILALLIFFPLFHHLWFLWYLCWLVAAFAIYAKASAWLKTKPPAWLVTSPIRYAWLIPLTILPQSTMGLLFPTFGPDTSAGLLPMPQILSYYAIFFFFGAIYFDCDDAAGSVGRNWRITLPVALLVVFPMGHELTIGGFGILGNETLDSGWCRPSSVVLQVVFAWLMSFGLMGMFRELFSKENRTMRYISDSSYWLYLAHLPLVIVIQAVMRNWPIPAFVKFSIVCAVTSALLLASYQYCVRYTRIGSLLNGPRKRPQSD